MRIYLFAAAVAVLGISPITLRAEPAKGKDSRKSEAGPSKDAKKEPTVTRTKTGAVQFEALRIETEKEGPGVIFIDNWTPSTKREFSDEAKGELDTRLLEIRSLNRSFDSRVRQVPDDRQIQRETATRETERKLLSLDVGRVKTDRATVQR